ncbi:MAG: ComEC/Rec2 family competence protein [Lentisphaeria bacterium]|nr:ComEC/Rec2 family competence protein [Lentisphaeria bacterium]
MVKIPFPRLEIRGLTLLAIGAGAGAAIGGALVPVRMLIPALLFPLLLRKRIGWYGAGLVVCLLSGWLQHTHERAILNRIPVRAGVVTGEFRCLDRRTTAVGKLAAPDILRGEVDLGKGPFPAAMVQPRAMPRILYGEKVRFTGRLFPAVPAGLVWDGETVVGRERPLYGERPLLIADTAVKLPEALTLQQRAFRLRDLLLRRLLENVDDPTVCAMAGKMFFSASTGAPRQLSRAFAASGTIHIFSVSGLHVTVLAGLLLILLRPVPLVWRCRLVALAVPVYVACTGASPPAIRAGVMVCVWCVLRSMLFYAPGWNAMMLTWCAFAVWSPEMVGSLGTQYSFGITAALILAMEKLQQISRRDRELLSLMPSRAKLTDRARRAVALRNHLRVLFGLAVTAFAAGSGLSLLRQHLFIPGSIIANLLLPWFTPVLFGGMIFKLTLGTGIPGLDLPGAWVLTAGFRMLAAAVTAAADWFGPVAAAEPPVWYTALFYLMLFAALGLRRNRNLTWFCAGTAALMLIILPLRKEISPGTLLVISRGADTPALLACLPPGGATAEIVDVPDSATGALAGKILRREGTLRARVGFSAGTRNHNGGLQALARQLPCAVMITEYSRKPSRAFQRNLDGENIRCRTVPGRLPITAPDGNRVTWRTADGIRIRSENTDRGRRITIRFRDGRTVSSTLPWSSLPIRWRVPYQHDPAPRGVDQEDHGDPAADGGQQPHGPRQRAPFQQDISGPTGHAAPLGRQIVPREIFHASGPLQHGVAPLLPAGEAVQ